MSNIVQVCHIRMFKGLTGPNVSSGSLVLCSGTMQVYFGPLYWTLPAYLFRVSGTDGRNMPNVRFRVQHKFSRQHCREPGGLPCRVPGAHQVYLEDARASRMKPTWGSSSHLHCIVLTLAIWGSHALLPIAVFNRDHHSPTVYSCYQFIDPHEWLGWPVSAPRLFSVSDCLPDSNLHYTCTKCTATSAVAVV